jgi:exodeoxyribonuclease-3
MVARRGTPRITNTGTPRGTNTGTPRITNTGNPHIANPGKPRSANTGNPRTAPTVAPPVAAGSTPRAKTVGEPGAATAGKPRAAAHGTLRIATWNINSLRLRLPLMHELVAALDPDVICLQETKVPDDLFPHQAKVELGYPHAAWRGMKGYNGVAIFSRRPIEVLDLAPDWCGKGDCRHLAVSVDAQGGPVELHDFYVPAGGDIPDRELNPKYGHKLDFIAEARDWFAARAAASGPARPGLTRTILVGDLNIAPLEHDVWSHKQLLNVVSHTPPETAGLLAWQHTGFVDAVRHFVPADEKLFTWWSYRNRDWRLSDRGRRLDHIWVTPDLQGALRRHTVLRDARDWDRGSDHAPVCVELAL